MENFQGSLSDLADLDVANVSSPLWLSQGGECCGFDAWIEAGQVHTAWRGCGFDTGWDVSPIPFELVRQAILAANLANPPWDEWGEVYIPVHPQFGIKLDKSEGLGWFTFTQA